jgi:hypothetical protein
MVGRKFGIRRSFGHVNLRAGSTQFQLLGSYKQGVMFLVCGCYWSGGAACQTDPNGGVTRLQSHCGQPVHYRKARIATSSHPQRICIKAWRTRRSKEAGSVSAPKSDVPPQLGNELRAGVSKTEVGNTSETVFSSITRANPNPLREKCGNSMCGGGGAIGRNG